MKKFINLCVALWKFFEGKKTYIVSALIFILGGLHALGVLSDATFISLLTALNAGGLAALRASSPK